MNTIIILCVLQIVPMQNKNHIPKDVQQKQFVLQKNEVVLQEERKMLWYRKAIEETTWDEAEAYCRNLKVSNESGWRLPTIDELRTIIEDCEATKLGGSCRILDNEGRGAANSEQTGDCSCEVRKLPKRNGEFYYQLYWNKKIWKEIRRRKSSFPYYWSSTPVSDNSQYVWRADFGAAEIGSAQKTSKENALCVKEKVDAS